jgi:tRNA G18 (ribose-2'-O)-methylase SpoU
LQAIESVPLQEYKFPERSALLLGREREGVPVEFIYILKDYTFLQASESLPLQEYKFPERSALLLGREREGVPVELLNLVDVCVEIPQAGLIRYSRCNALQYRGHL